MTQFRDEELLADVIARLIGDVRHVAVGKQEVHATAGVLDRPIPGIAEAIRASGLAAGAVDAGLSRGLAGVSGSTLLVNLAASRAAVRDGMATLTPLVGRVIEELSWPEQD